MRLPRKLTSSFAPGLVDLVWSVASRRGHAQFEARERPIGILDDHKFLTDVGVPSSLLIDKEYPPWHTREDTLEQVSAQSLGAVADTVLHAVLELAESPLP